jgi:hypothetical protein
MAPNAGQLRQWFPTVGMTTERKNGDSGEEVIHFPDFLPDANASCILASAPKGHAVKAQSNALGI